MPRAPKGKKCVYATLEGKSRTVAFKSWLYKKLGHDKKKKTRDKNGKFIVSENHVSQIMKRRAAENRARTQATKQVWRNYAEREAALKRAEKFNRAFYGTTDKMEQEKKREEWSRKYKERKQKEIENMPYNEWFAKYRNNKTLASEWCAPKANIIRTAWYIYCRRAMAKDPRKFYRRLYKIPKRAYPARSITFSPVVHVAEYSKNSTWDEAPHTKKYKAMQTIEQKNEKTQKIIKKEEKQKIKLGTLLPSSREFDEMALAKSTEQVENDDEFDEMDWANSTEEVEDDDDWVPSYSEEW